MVEGHVIDFSEEPHTSLACSGGTDCEMFEYQVSGFVQGHADSFITTDHNHRFVLGHGDKGDSVFRAAPLYLALDCRTGIESGFDFKCDRTGNAAIVQRLYCDVQIPVLGRCGLADPVGSGKRGIAAHNLYGDRIVVMVAVCAAIGLFNPRDKRVGAAHRHERTDGNGLGLLTIGQ